MAFFVADKRGGDRPRPAIFRWAWLPLVLCASSQGGTQARTAPLSVPQPCRVLGARLATGGEAIRRNDPKQMDTARLQKALDLCLPGQAVVLRAAGQGAQRKDAFLSAPLILPRGVTLFLAADVTLYASRNPRDYDLARGSCGAPKTGKAAQCKPFVFSYQAAYSGIAGPGAIDGQGGTPPHPGEASWWQLVRKAQAAGGTIAVPSLVSDYESQGFQVTGVTLRDAAGIHLAVFKTTDFEASGLRIESPLDSRAGTGVLLSNVQGAHLNGAWIRTPSHAVSLQASILGWTGLVHLNRLMVQGGSGILIGNPEFGNVRDVHIEDARIDGAHPALTLQLGARDGKKPRGVAMGNLCTTAPASALRVLDSDGRPVSLAKAQDILQWSGSSETGKRRADQGLFLRCQGMLPPPSSVALAFAPLPSAAEPPGTKHTLAVAADGSEEYRSIQLAVNALPVTGGTVLIKPGTYREVVTIRKPHVKLRGEGADPKDVIIVYNNVAGRSGGTFNTATVFVEAPDAALNNLTITNDAGYGRGQGVALAVTGDRDTFRHIEVHGHQDTLFAASRYCYGDYGPCVPARQYFSHCSVDGNVDFLFGDGMTVFDHCALHGNPGGNVMYTAQSRHSPGQKSGYVFDRCTLTAAPRSHGIVSLGRPWRPYATVVYLYTRMNADILPQGWTEWPRFGKPSLPTAFYAEFHSTGPGASPRTREPYSRQLTAAEAKRFLPRVFLRGNDDWNPAGK